MGTAGKRGRLHLLAVALCFGQLSLGNGKDPDAFLSQVLQNHEHLQGLFRECGRLQGQLSEKSPLDQFARYFQKLNATEASIRLLRQSIDHGVRQFPLSPEAKAYLVQLRATTEQDFHTVHQERRRAEQLARAATKKPRQLALTPEEAPTEPLAPGRIHVFFVERPAEKEPLVRLVMDPALKSTAIYLPSTLKSQIPANAHPAVQFGVALGLLPPAFWVEFPENVPNTYYLLTEGRLPVHHQRQWGPAVIWTTPWRPESLPLYTLLEGELTWAQLHELQEKKALQDVMCLDLIARILKGER